MFHCCIRCRDGEVCFITVERCYDRFVDRGLHFVQRKPASSRLVSQAVGVSHVDTSRIAITVIGVPESGDESVGLMRVVVTEDGLNIIRRGGFASPAYVAEQRSLAACRY